MSVHDFTPFCPRPHLWEVTAGRFCGVQPGRSRCHACLAADWPVARGFEREWRAATADLLGAAAALVFPSDYLRSAWRDLLPALEGGASTCRAGRRPSRTSSNLVRPVAVRHVALVGATKPAKGAALLAEIVRDVGGLDFTVLGGGDA